MIADIFNTIGQAVTSFATALSNAVSSVTSMFYTTGEGGGITLLGNLVLISVGVGLIYWGFRLIKGLLHRA